MALVTLNHRVKSVAATRDGVNLYVLPPAAITVSAIPVTLKDTSSEAKAGPGVNVSTCSKVIMVAAGATAATVDSASESTIARD